MATGLMLPDFLERDAAEFAASSNEVYTRSAVDDAQVGQQFIFHGEISNATREFEKGLVVGTKSVWKERDPAATRRAQSRADRQRARAGWRPVDEYTQVLSVQLDTGSEAKLQLDSVRIEGDQTVVEEIQSGKKFKWQGLRRGTEISARGTIATLSPLRIEQTRGQSLYVGAPDSMVQGEAETTTSVSKWTYLGGLGFAGFGALLFLLGFVLPSSKNR